MAVTGRRTAFFGTPAAAIPALAALAAGATIDLVVTRPDRPRGRSGSAQPPPVKVAAEAWGLRTAQPARAAEVERLLDGIDLAVVVAYGQILPATLLAVPVRGFVNLHFSRLPRWRGAAPVARALLAGDATTGVDLMELDEGMDTGPTIAGVDVFIEPEDTTGTLTARLAGIGAGLLARTLPALLDGSAPRTPQPAAGVTAAPKLTSSEAQLTPQTMPADTCERMVRAFAPNPGAWGIVDGSRLKVWRARARPETGAAPGEVRLDDGVPVVGTPTGSLELIEVQPAGKSRMSASVWARGHRGPFRWE
jgi:methionyl-tRNA formyltransferase